eukprot:4288481-Pleurochrysis_carterae.AAC.1
MAGLFNGMQRFALSYDARSPTCLETERSFKTEVAGNCLTEVHWKAGPTRRQAESHSRPTGAWRR